MGERKIDLIIHPIRLRIIAELANRHMSPRQLGEVLSDVPQATLYCHINVLSEAGMIQVVETRPVNGATERIYRMAEGVARLSSEELANLSREEHLRYFTLFASSLIDTFAQYTADADPQFAFEEGMSDSEAAQIKAGLPAFAKLPNGAWVIAPDAHHAWNAEHPELFTEMIDTWIMQEPLPKALIPAF